MLTGLPKSCKMRDELPPLVSLESLLFGSEDNKFENDKFGAMESSVACSSSALHLVAQGPHQLLLAQHT